MFITLYETENFAFDYDGSMGVAQYRRKADENSTLLMTGSEAEDEKRNLHRMHQKTHSPRYPKAAPPFNILMDSLAAEYEFSGNHYTVFVQAADNSQWGEGWEEEVEAGNKATAEAIAIERIRAAIEQPDADLFAVVAS